MAMVRDLIGGVAAIAVGSLYLFMALQLRASALSDSVGPAGVPKALAYAMIGLGLVLCVQALVAGRASRRALPGNETAEDADGDLDAEARRAGLRGIYRAAGMLLLGILYLMVVRYLGYILSIAGLIAAAALYQGALLSWRVFAIALAGALVYWLVFVWLLGIPLPAGMLPSLF